MGAKILLVDDEPGVLRSLERLLRQDGHEVLTAGDGARALHLLREHEVALIICDQLMPGMSGSKVLAEVRKTQPEAVRIALTGHQDHADSHEALESVRAPRCPGNYQEPTGRPRAGEATMKPEQIFILGEGDVKNDLDGGESEVFATSEVPIVTTAHRERDRVAMPEPLRETGARGLSGYGEAAS